MSQRAETGVMQFGDDWPGVFIRGDNAFAYAMALRDLVKNGDQASPVSLAIATNLAALLEASDTRNKPEPQRAMLSE